MMLTVEMRISFAAFLGFWFGMGIAAWISRRFGPAPEYIVQASTIMVVFCAVVIYLLNGK